MFSFSIFTKIRLSDFRVTEYTVCDQLFQRNYLALSRQTCLLFNIPIKPQIYFVTLLILNTFMTWVISLRNLNEKCIKDSAVSFSIDVDNRTVLVPNVTHEFHLSVNHTTSTFPSLAAILMVFSKQGTDMQMETECHLILEVAFPRLLIMPPSLQMREKQMGIKYVLQAEKRTHYILENPFDEIDWVGAERFCSTHMKGSLLLYFSHTEIKEVSQIYQGEPYIIFTGIQGTKEVRNLSLNIVNWNSF